MSKIAAVTVMKNEEYILPFFLRNYLPWVDAIIAYDNNSNDKTAEILKSCPKVRYSFLDTDGLTYERIILGIKNDAYKLTEFDWVMPVDADEMIVGIPNIRIMIERAIAFGADCIESDYIDLVGQSVPADDGKSLINDLVSKGVFRNFRDNFGFAWDPKIGYYGTNEKEGKGIMFKTGSPVELLPGSHAYLADRKVFNDRAAMFHARLLSKDYIVGRCHKYTLSPENLSVGWWVNQQSEDFMGVEWDVANTQATLWKDILREKRVGRPTKGIRT